MTLGVALNPSGSHNAVDTTVAAARDAAAAGFGSIWFGQRFDYDAIPSYQRVVAAEGLERAADLALIGSAAQVRAGVQRYFDAGATEVVLTQTNLLGADAQRDTLTQLG